MQDEVEDDDDLGPVLIMVETETYHWIGHASFHDEDGELIRVTDMTKHTNGYVYLTDPAAIMATSPTTQEVTIDRTCLFRIIPFSKIITIAEITNRTALQYQFAFNRWQVVKMIHEDMPEDSPSYLIH